MKNLTILTFGFLTALLSLCSCSNECLNDPPCSTDTCLFFPESWSLGEPQIVIEEADVAYNFPAFNPNNPDEFSYFRYASDLSFYELRKHNIQTGADALLCNVNPGTSPGWAGNGKIYFDGGGIVYVVDATTGNLETLNAPGGIYQPRVGRNNDRMICDFRPPGAFYIAILTLDGQVTDSLGHEIQSYAWVNDTAFAIFKIDKTYKILSYPSMQEIGAGSMDFVPYLVQYYGDTRFITYRGGDLYFFDYMTAQFTPIIENCGDRYSYSNFAVAPDKSEMVAVRNHYECVDSLAVQPLYSFEREIVRVTLPTGKLEYFQTIP